MPLTRGIRMHTLGGGGGGYEGNNTFVHLKWAPYFRPINIKIFFRAFSASEF